MIEITQVNASLDEAGDENACLIVGKRVAKRVLRCKDSEIKSIELHRKSIDARKKRDVHFILSFRVELTSPHLEREAVDSVAERDRSRVRAIEDDEPSFPSPASDAPQERPVVVGAGCAGLFAALTLAEAGLKPLLIERGDPAFRRSQAIDLFLKERILDPESNIQFGLGGAGTFSDGKLNTGQKIPPIALSSKPSSKRVRPAIFYGMQSRTLAPTSFPQLSPLYPSASSSSEVSSVIERSSSTFASTRLAPSPVLISNRPKTPLASQSRQSTSSSPAGILLAMFLSSLRATTWPSHKRRLPWAFASSIRSATSTESNTEPRRDILPSEQPLTSSSPIFPTAAACSRFACAPAGRLSPPLPSRATCASTAPVSMPATDAMQMPPYSLTSRPRTFPNDDPLAGVELQRACEAAAYRLGGSNWNAPAQLVGDFLAGRASKAPGKVKPTYPLGVTWTAIDEALPQHIVESLRLGLPLLGKKLRGYDRPDAVLTGVETRSSSPVTVTRDRTCHAVSTPGLYPCGEGAGYAGGIMSAATDGIRCAEALIADL